MKAKILIVAISLIMIAACSKDKFNSTPTLTFESINAATFYPGETVTIKLRLTDKEGDFKLDSTGSGYTKPYLYYKRFSYMCSDVVDTTTSIYNVPAFPTNKFLDAFIDINYTSAVQGQYPTLSGCPRNGGQDDSAYLKIWIKDEAGHTSDTVTTPDFKLIKN